MKRNIKLRSIVSNIKSKILTEGKLTDWPGYNTPAALNKEKEIEGKKVKPEDSITDLDLNTLNRNRTIKEYSYGPLNPDDEKGSKPFWEDKAEFWNTTPEAAKESRCSNCGAFDQKKTTLNKIAKAIGEEGETIIKNANIGFCEFFWFKCAGARTCDAWVGGGPIK
tara:strand:+ start:96 stop:593 length:498 start_codon:yes stop_codon:yes gene_type:complete